MDAGNAQGNMENGQKPFTVTTQCNELKYLKEQDFATDIVECEGYVLITHL